MAKKYYIPARDNDKALWLKNFASKLSLYAQTLRISEAEVKSINDDSVMFSYTLDCLESIKMYNQQMIVYKDTLRDGENTNVKAFMPLPPIFPAQPAFVKDGIFLRVKKLAQNIKTRDEYTEDIGKALGIIGETTTIDYSTLQPYLQASVQANKVLIKWKKGIADSLNIYVKRDGNEFVFIGNSSKNSYTDSHLLPNEATNWIFKGIYVVKNVEVGMFSDEENILVKKFV